MLKKKNLFVCFGILSFSGNAQSVIQPLYWFSFNTNIKLHPLFGLTGDAQQRMIGFQNQQQYYRLGLDMYVSNALSVVPFGMGYFVNYKYGKQPTKFINNEIRIWQQIFYKHTASRISINHRLRLEERFIQDHSNADSTYLGYSNVQFRIRYRIYGNIPLNKPTMEAKTFYVCVWDEAFISIGNKVDYNYPDQNRIFVGTGYQFTKDFSIQVGVLHQLLIKQPAGTLAEHNTGALLQINYNVNLNKKE
ncbi:MAG: DUF2490 domain-containing protein [Chitinophagaceae bacterium]|nr:DUF2490 domain-containing protein [Chitinophagaceae bacterium]